MNIHLFSTANLAILLSLLHAPPLTTSLSFHMASFEPNPSKAELDLSGDAAISASGSALQLDRGASNSSGRALYHKAMQLWVVNGSSTQMADFSTLFSLNVSSASIAGSVGGDGTISFIFLPPASASASYPKPGHGGSLVSSGTDSKENPSVAVKFELGLDRFGIDVSSTKSGAYVNVSGGGGGRVNARVDYDSNTKNLRGTLGFSGTLVSYRFSKVVDLSVVLPDKVRIGFTASSGRYVEIHEVLSWSFDSSLQEEEEIRVVKMGLGTTWLVVVVVVLLVLLMAVIIASVYVFRWKPGTIAASGGRSSTSSEVEIAMDAAGLKRFSYMELSDATNNFAEESKIGEGGFGCVYRGRLTMVYPGGQTTIDVAIKKWKARRLNDQGRTELLKEMTVMSKTRHRNLIRLLGWCEQEGGELLLVSEFIPNGNLEQHLFERHDNQVLGWAKRYEIACRLAAGLEYLHERLDHHVAHRDIKASNVMIDDDFNPKLGDFGLARFTEHGRSMNVTNSVAGSYGYMDPELTMTLSKYTKSSDVYSFGILALEIATGIRATTLALSIRNLHAQDAPLERVLGMIDPTLGMDYNMDEARRLFEVGFRCCDPISTRRPSMTQVMNDLTFGVGTSTSSSTAACTPRQALASYRRFATM